MRLFGPFKGYSEMLFHEKKQNGWREDLNWKRLKMRFLVVTETSPRDQMAVLWLFIKIVGTLLIRIF